MITRQDIINDLLRLHAELNRIPSFPLYIKFGKHNKLTLRRKFGTWNNALNSAFNLNLPKRIQIPKQSHECPTCKILTKNPKYCSSKCAAVTNNLIKNAKAPSINKCSNCENTIPSRKKLCNDCKDKKNIALDNMTIAQLITLKGRVLADSAIRSNARAIARKLTYNKCVICGYSKHIEIAHIKAVAKFDKTTLCSVINAKENLVPLCRNHHWEFDHNMLAEELPASFTCGKYALLDEDNNTHCMYCSCITTAKATVCKDCLNTRRNEKINWPSLAILLKLLETKSYREVAKELGVSDNAIRKRLRVKFGISKDYTYYRSKYKQKCLENTYCI